MKRVLKVGGIGLVGFALGIACTVHGIAKYLDKVRDELVDLDDLDEFFCDDLAEREENA